MTVYLEYLVYQAYMCDLMAEIAEHALSKLRESLSGIPLELNEEIKQDVFEKYYGEAMPLKRGKKNIGKNIKTEEAAGKSHAQAVAIALHKVKRKKRGHV